MLQVLLGIHVVPPRGVVLQPAGKPRIDGLFPTGALGEIKYLVVLVGHLYQGGRAV